MALLCTTSYSQEVYVTGGVLTKTLTVGIGFLSDDGYQLSISGDLPYSRADKSRFYSLNGGKEFIVLDNWVITPTVGAGFFWRKDFSDYDKGGTIKEVSYHNIIYGLEVGKNLYRGRISFTSKFYDSRLSFGISFRGFFGNKRD